MSFIIHNGTRPLSYWHPNGNGTIKDLIGFSNDNYFIHSTKEEAENHLKYMHRSLRNMEHLNTELLLNVKAIISKLKITELN